MIDNISRNSSPYVKQNKGVDLTGVLPLAATTAVVCGSFQTAAEIANASRNTNVPIKEIINSFKSKLPDGASLGKKALNNISSKAKFLRSSNLFKNIGRSFIEGAVIIGIVRVVMGLIDKNKNKD